MISTCTMHQHFTPADAVGQRQAQLRHVESLLQTLSQEAEARVCAANTLLTTAHFLRITGVPCDVPSHCADEKLRAAFHTHEAMLRAIAEHAQIEQKRIVAQGHLMIALARERRLQEFTASYEPTLGAQPSFAAHDRCCICDGDAPSGAIYRMRCCAAAMCHACLSQHSCESVVGTKATCPFCRAPYSVFRPDAS